MNTPNAKETASEEYHGSDGFGDVYTDQPDIGRLQKEHAVCALHRITSEDPGNMSYNHIHRICNIKLDTFYLSNPSFNQGNVSLICLGPLTNIAMAIKMYPEFMSNVKEFFVMGGNSTGNFNNFIRFIKCNGIIFLQVIFETCSKGRVT